MVIPDAAGGLDSGAPQTGLIQTPVEPLTTTLGVHMVALVPDFQAPQPPYLYRLVQTDSTGHFRAQGIPPGRYRIFAADEGEGLLTLPFMSAAAVRGAKIELGENQTLQVDALLLKFGENDVQ